MENDDVLTIEDGVLRECKKDAVDVVIPEGVKEIVPEAFRGCSSLSSVAIPSTVTKIGSVAFWCCESLSSVVIGEGVTTIGTGAFLGCRSLKSIVIPSTVTEIGGHAFGGCGAVENVVSASASFPFNGKTLKLYDATKKTKKVILVLSAAKEKAKKAKIEQVQLASAGSVLDSILSEHKAEAEVVRNEKDAYLRVKAGNGGVEIILPDSKVQKWMKTLPGLLDLAATGADAGALRKYAAENALADSSRRYLSVRDGRVRLKYFSSPVHLVIPEGVTEICGGAFALCKSLASVVIGEGVTKIGGEAFYCCPSLASVVIPEGVTEICNRAFGGCPSLSSVEFGGTMAQWEAVEGRENLLGYVPAETVKCTDGEAAV